MSRWSLEVGKDSVGRRRAGAAASLQARRVLVIDDDWECIELLSTILAMEGFQVVTASDATRGVAAAQEFEPHIVLVDLMLPPCGGVECALQLRRSERGAGTVAYVSLPKARLRRHDAVAAEETMPASS